MKKTMKFVLAMAMILMMSGGAMAQGCFNAQGGVMVPGMYHVYRGGADWLSTYLIISNISDKDVSCRVTIRNQDGLDVTHLGGILTGGNDWAVVSSGSGDFDIPAYSTRVFHLQPSSPSKLIVGYAKIEWKSTDTRLKNALIASGFAHRVYSAGRSEFHIPINNGQPF